VLSLRDPALTPLAVTLFRHRLNARFGPKAAMFNPDCLGIMG